jgi:hypothetical protein
MSAFAAFRRQPVQQPYALALQTLTLPAPTRGIVQSENEAYMGAGGANVQDNWAPTMRGVKLRGGSIRWSDLHALDATVPPVPSPLRLPVISAFEYQSGNTAKMFAANATKLFDVTVNGPPTLVKSGQTSGNYVAAQMANAAVSALGTSWMIVCNESGDYPLRFNGSTWVTLDGTVAGTPTDGASKITGPVGSAVEFGHGLSYVWKYRSRLYFAEAGSMNAWYLPIDSVGGVLAKIPLAGAATRGGKLIAGTSWSLDAGDGIDQKNVFITDQGEVLIFTGTDPADAANWRQEGRYNISPPLGMNAHIAVGGDLLMLTVDGIVPLSQAITKDSGQLELAMITRNIKPLWRENVTAKRNWAWTAKKWDEYGALFVTTPGGAPGSRYLLAANNVTGAWCRFSWDATCFIRMRADMFFGTQDGIVMQADRTGYDDGLPYVATLVGGWEMFGAPANEVVWLQARASFHSSGSEPFQPQLSATTDYIITLPPAPPAWPDPGLREVWDQGLWDHARWDQPSVGVAPVRNTGWVSIGNTGFAHAPIVQVTVAQAAKPNVEMIAISATFNVAGVNV